MLDWVFEGIIAWVGEHVNSLLDAVSGIMLDTLGVDMVVMTSYFPFLESAFQTIRYIGIILLLLMVIWQLFRSFTGPILEAENPLTLLARGTLAAFCIWNSREIFDILLYIARAPYEVLQGIPGSSHDITSFNTIFSFLQANLLTAINGVAMSNPILTLLAIILIIALGWNYLKLLLEVVERYIMVGILYFTSPLAFGMLGTKSTANVFKAWCRMAGSELLLLVLNVWFVRGYNSGVTVLLMNSGVVAGRPAAGAILCIFCLLAYLKIAQRFDAYLATLGLNTAQTGGNLGMEMLVMTRMIGSMIGHGGFLHGGGRVGVNTGNVTAGTTGNAAPTGFGARIRAAFNPETYRTNAISAGPNQGFGGLNGWALNTIAARQIRQGHATDAATVSRITTGTITPRGGAFAGTAADNSLPGFMPVFRGHTLSGTSIENGHITTTAVSSATGKKAEFEAFSAAAYEKPEGSVRTITASDGSKWFVTASGEGASDFFSSPEFSGSFDEGAKIASMFTADQQISTLRTVGEGQMEATYTDGTSGMLYSAALFEEPDGPHEVITDANGLDWYKMEPRAPISEFTDGMPENRPAADMAGTGEQAPGKDADVTVPPINTEVDTGIPPTDTNPSGSIPGSENKLPADNVITDAADGTVPVAPSGTEIHEGSIVTAVPGADTVIPVPDSTVQPAGSTTIEPVETAAPADVPGSGTIPVTPSEGSIDSSAVVPGDNSSEGSVVSFVPGADTTVPVTGETIHSADSNSDRSAETTEVGNTHVPDAVVAPPAVADAVSVSGVTPAAVPVQPTVGSVAEDGSPIAVQNLSGNDAGNMAAVEMPVFTGIPDGTQITQTGNGMYEMHTPDGQTHTIYDSTKYEVSGTENNIAGTVTDTAGNSYIIPSESATVSEISPTNVTQPAAALHSDTQTISHTDSHTDSHGRAPTEDLSSSSGSVVPPVTKNPSGSADTGHYDSQTYEHSGIESSYGRFSSFMPGYSSTVARVDTTMRDEGQFTVYNTDGSGTRFYDMAVYKPVGNYRVFEDRNGHSWAAYDGAYQSVRHVVTDQHGNPVLDKRGRAKERYETVMSFRQEPQRRKEPVRKKSTEIKAPRRKKK